MKTRIALSGPREGLQSPFAGLEMAGLPEGVEQIAEPDSSKPRAPGRIVLRKEKAHRGGKPVIVAAGFADHHSAPAIEGFGRSARKSLGCGGTVRDREIELQGDQPGPVRKFFQSLGFRVDGV